MIARIGKGLLTLVLVLGLLLPGVPISGQEITDITAGLAATTELTLDETYTEDVCQVILIPATRSQWQRPPMARKASSYLRQTRARSGKVSTFSRVRPVRT